MTTILAKKLIKRYNICIIMVKFLSLKASKLLLIYFCTDLGICYCSKVVFNINVMNDPFVIANQKYGAYWCPTPIQANTKAKLVEYLKYRIEILKTHKSFKG